MYQRILKSVLVLGIVMSPFAMAETPEFQPSGSDIHSPMPNTISIRELAKAYKSSKEAESELGVKSGEGVDMEARAYLLGLERQGIIRDADTLMELIQDVASEIE